MNESTLVSATDTAHNFSAYSAESFMQFDGVNPLVGAAQPLLLLMIALKQVRHMQPHQITRLKRNLVDEILVFTQKSHDQDYPSRLVLAARYCLCTALDEVILSTGWGSEGGWAQQTLLSIVQKETWGGERFYVVLDEMAKSPSENMHILELLYIILSLGFEGRNYNREQNVRDEIKHRLFHLITLHRPEPDKLLSPSLKVLQQDEPVITVKFSRWQIAGLTLTLLLVLNVIFNMVSYFSGINIMHEFMAINQEVQQKSI